MGPEPDFGEARPWRTLGFVPGARLGPAALVTRFAARLRFPTLFFLTAALFVLDLVFPDTVPFVDEILLGLGTLVLGSLRERGRERGAGGQDDAGPSQR